MIGLKSGISLVEIDSAGQQRVVQTNLKVNFFRDHLAGMTSQTTFYLKCKKSKDHNYSVFSLSKVEDPENPLLISKLNPAPDDCLKNTVVTLDGAGAGRLELELGYDCKVALGEPCAHENECLDRAAVCQMVAKNRTSCTCGLDHVEYRAAGDARCYYQPRKVGDECKSSIQCQKIEGKCRTVGDVKVCVCNSPYATVSSEGRCIEHSEQPRNNMEFSRLGSTVIKQLGRPSRPQNPIPIKQECIETDSKDKELFPIRWNLNGLVLSLRLKGPSTSILKINLNHQDQQSQAVKPVYTIGMDFSQNSITLQKYSHSPVLTKNVGKMPISEDAFNSYKLQLFCDETLTCSLLLNQDDTVLFRQDLDRFDLFMQPNLLTFDSNDPMIIKFDCALDRGEHCMDDTECQGELRCLLSGDRPMLVGKIMGQGAWGKSKIKTCQ